MTELLIESVTPRRDTLSRGRLDGCRSTVGSLYSKSVDSRASELKHSKSDVIIKNPSVAADLHYVRDDSVLQRSACAACEDSVDDARRVTYFVENGRESEDRRTVGNARRMMEEYPTEVQRSPSRYVGLYDKVDPEDSISAMITDNDFYRFVLFKRHYEKYLKLSQKYEEARNIAYYLEEKYHEIKAERDGLARARRELERKLERRELELHEKEEELFLQLEKVVRLEEECEKLRVEKEKFEQWKDRLQKEKDEAFRLMQRQAVESETVRRGLERARQDVVRQVAVITAEKNTLQKENEQLKETLCVERKGVGNYLVDLADQKKRISQNIVGLEREVTQLQFVARQTASLNSQFKKGMKHLASCKRRKCSVCTYTRATFGEYGEKHQKKFLSCIQAPLQDLRNWIRPVPFTDKYSSCSSEEESSVHKDEGETEGMSTASGCSVFLHSSPIPSVRSQYSYRRAYSSGQASASGGECSSPSPDLRGMGCPPDITYIDEASSSSSAGSSYGDESGQSDDLVISDRYSIRAHSYGISLPTPIPTDTSLTSTMSSDRATTVRAFSSDSGFSSEMYDTGLKPSLRSYNNRQNSENERVHGKDGSEDGKGGNLQRSKWTASFRKLIHRVSKRFQRTHA